MALDARTVAFVCTNLREDATEARADATAFFAAEVIPQLDRAIRTEVI